MTDWRLKTVGGLMRDMIIDCGFKSLWVEAMKKLFSPALDLTQPKQYQGGGGRRDHDMIDIINFDSSLSTHKKSTRIYHFTWLELLDCNARDSLGVGGSLHRLLGTGVGRPSVVFPQIPYTANSQRSSINHPGCIEVWANWEKTTPNARVKLRRSNHRAAWLDSSPTPSDIRRSAGVWLGGGNSLIISQ